MPGSNVIYSLLGLGIFGGYTVLELQSHEEHRYGRSGPARRGDIFDILNVFTFLNLFGSREVK